MRENKACPYEGWQQMPTQELDQILQAELEKEHPNEEVVLPILRELEEREKDRPVEKSPEVLEILEKLKEHETSFKQSIHKRRWIAGVAAVAAAACIVVMALPRSVGAESFFDVLFRWTSGVFEFFDPEQEASNPPVEFVFETDHPGLRQLYEKVVEMGITERVVPTWLSKDFELTELKVSPVSGGNKAYAKFENGTDTIFITYLVTTGIKTKVEKQDTPFELYDYANVSHFIIDNGENTSVTWTVDGVECSIVTDIPKDDVYKVIMSIYRRSLQ